MHDDIVLVGLIVDIKFVHIIVMRYSRRCIARLALKYSIVFFFVVFFFEWSGRARLSRPFKEVWIQRRE